MDEDCRKVEDMKTGLWASLSKKPVPLRFHCVGQRCGLPSAHVQILHQARKARFQCTMANSHITDTLRTQTNHLR